MFKLLGIFDEELSDEIAESVKELDNHRIG
jgi:hypothetical protein